VHVFLFLLLVGAGDASQVEVQLARCRRSRTEELDLAVRDHGKLKRAERASASAS